MNIKTKINLLIASIALAGSVLAGCGSGDADVDPKAMESRNSQRGATPGGGAPSAAGTTTGQ